MVDPDFVISLVPLAALLRDLGHALDAVRTDALGHSLVYLVGPEAVLVVTDAVSPRPL
jgi:hypothetical protein